MRVALNVEQLLYRAPGGIGRYTAKLVTLLPRLFPEDVLLPFIALHRRGDVEQAYQRAGVDAAIAGRPIRLALPRPLLYDAWHIAGGPALGWLSSPLRSAQLVHAPSVAVPVVGRARLVVTVHDAAPELFPEAFPVRGRRFHSRGLRAAARRADLVITVSEAAAAEIATHTLIPADRLRVVPGGVDLTPASPVDVECTLSRHRLTDAPYVFWLGTLEPRKNVAVLLTAFARLLAARPDLPHRLVLAGSAGWRHEGLLPLREQAVLRERDRLRVLGPIPDDELRAVYAGAVLFAFPSRHEGFGLPVLEAMAQGTPVVCADIPALREVAGGAAHLVPPMDTEAWVAALGDLLEGAAHHPAETTAPMAAAGRARAAGFSWERCIASTHAVYAEALA